jgi:PAS domain S-box-containing protein
MGLLALSSDELLAALGHAVIATDLDGTVLDWNPAAERLYGWTAEEAVGRAIASLCVPDLAKDVAAEIMDALRAGQAWSGSFPVRDRDGRVFPALVTDTGVYREDELVGIVGVSTRFGGALRPLLERAADAALVVRPGGLVTYASPAVRRLFGWEEDELLGSSVVEMIHPDYRARLQTVLESVAGSTAHRPPQELRVRRRDGWVWAEAALTNFLDDPAVRGIVCNLRLSLARSLEDEEPHPAG